MNRLRLYLLALAALFVCSVKADEGMWLLQLMQQQHSIDMMKKQGLKLEAQDLYNPNGISLKDAVGIFGGGCTGEIISPEGLILTNHHCGYASIQQHSSVEHDYLNDSDSVISFAAILALTISVISSIRSINVNCNPGVGSSLSLEVAQKPSVR